VICLLSSSDSWKEVFDLLVVDDAKETFKTLALTTGTWWCSSHGPCLGFLFILAHVLLFTAAILERKKILFLPPVAQYLIHKALRGELPILGQGTVVLLGGHDGSLRCRDSWL
jgi:hypothetical protein